MRLIIGDNPFFGVNHKAGSMPLDEEKVRFENAAKVVAEAARNQFSTFMLSAHPNYQKLLYKVDHEISETTKSIMELALVIPYPHSLNKLVAEGGYYALVRAIGYKALVASLFELIACFRSENTKGLITPVKRLIQIEIDSIHTRFITPKYICLHNIVTDILLAADRKDLLAGFAIGCLEMNFIPVFISQNPISLLNCRIPFSHVCCFTYNALGYMVNPGLQDVDKYLRDFRSENAELWAMQVFASGALSIERALIQPLMSYFQGIVYGTARQGRVSHFSNRIKEHIKLG